MNVSARNMLAGTVSAVKTGVVNTEVELTIKGGHSIVAIITNESVHHLGIKEGSEAYAIIKAPLVIIAKGAPDMKFSTRNVLEGKVTSIKPGSVNAEILLELPEGAIISSIITGESVSAMGLKVGDTATALFKASSVILAVGA